MQYGNFRVYERLNTNEEGLNRTMQYGNFFKKKEKTTQENKFKSYYVVWKQACGEKTRKISILFKSYYVVWKRNRSVWSS